MVRAQTDAAAMRTLNRCGNQCRRIDDMQARAEPFLFNAKWWNRVGDDDAIEDHVADHVVRTRHEQTVRSRCVNGARAGFAAGVRCAAQRGAGADQIVEDDDDLAAHIADQRATADLHRDGGIFRSAPCRFRAGDSAQLAKKMFRAFGGAKIRRNDRDIGVLSDRAEIIDK